VGSGTGTRARLARAVAVALRRRRACAAKATDGCEGHPYRPSQYGGTVPPIGQQPPAPANPFRAPAQFAPPPSVFQQYPHPYLCRPLPYFYGAPLAPPAPQQQHYHFQTSTFDYQPPPRPPPPAPACFAYAPPPYCVACGGAVIRGQAAVTSHGPSATTCSAVGRVPLPLPRLRRAVERRRASDPAAVVSILNMYVAVYTSAGVFLLRTDHVLELDVRVFLLDYFPIVGQFFLWIAHPHVGRREPGGPRTGAPWKP
jgi:hypothetical protein